MQVKLGEIEINVKKYVVEKYNNGSIFITDSEVKENDMDAFLSLYNSNAKKDQYFHTVFADQEFYGRFGELIYSKNEGLCKLRLVFVEAAGDQKEINPNTIFLTNDATHENTINKIVRQEIIMNQLCALLEEKNVLSREEIERIKTVKEDEYLALSREVYSKVKDLDEYLERKNETLEEMEHES